MNILKIVKSNYKWKVYRIALTFYCVNLKRNLYRIEQYKNKPKILPIFVTQRLILNKKDHSTDLPP